jgi:hypothetical protein
VPREGIFCALIQTVCTDLHGPVENPDLLSCDGGFLQHLREHMRGFHDSLRQKSSSLFILLGCSSIKIVSLMMQSMYLGLVERMAVWCSWMLCPKLILCSAMADLSGCSRPVFLNCQAMTQYQALASIIPGTWLTEKRIYWVVV